MLKSEIYKVLCSKRSVLIILIIFILPFIDLAMNIHGCFLDFWLHPEAYNNVLPATNILHASKASFLSASSEGHLTQILFLWLFPIYVLLIYGDTYIAEKKTGCTNFMIAKYGFRKYFLGKYLSAFILFFILTFLSLFLNFCLANIIFRNGISFSGYEQYAQYMNVSFFKWAMANPNITYFTYIIIFSLIAGGCGCLCVAMSILFSDYKYVYPLCFFIWMIQFLTPNYSDITAIIQPFTESTPSNMLTAAFIWLLILIIVVGTTRLLRYKKDVI